MKKLIFGGFVALALFIGSAAFLITKPGADKGSNNPSQIKGMIPNPQNAPMKPVGLAEANKRANVNRERADEARSSGETHVSVPVIVKERGAELGELPEKIDTVRSDPVSTPQIVEVIKYVYVQPEQQPKLTDFQEKLIEKQYNNILNNLPTGGFVVKHYEKGKRPEKSGNGVAAGRKYLIARAGDHAFARLTRGFNSDDPAAPIFVEIEDIDQYGVAGPLHNARLMGSISFSRTQAGVAFNSLTFANGQTIPIKAIAIREADARTGIAAKVDNHYLERYGALFLSSFIQGVGQVGQELVNQNRSIVYDGNGYYSSTANKTDWQKVGMGALLPVGQNLTSVLSQHINRPATMSSSVNTVVGIVFLEPVYSP